VLAIWALRMVPAGLPLRCSDMTLHMRTFPVSVETAVSDGAVSKSLGLSEPLGRFRETGPANTSSYVAPPSGGPSCQMPKAYCSPVTGDAGVRTQRQELGA
jgi:hypothetical protein